MFDCTPSPRDGASGLSLAKPSAQPTWIDRARDLESLAECLNRQHANSDAQTIIRAALDPSLGLKVGSVSSFGAESAVLLDLISKVDKTLPIVFLETGMHFFQTLQFRKQLSDRLGLTDVRLVTPDKAEKATLDPKDTLWQADADACCDLRKVRPLARATAGFDALITGRKRFQTADRATLQPFEVTDGTLRVNPLAAWDADRIEAWLDDNDLPRHPLVDQGYPSIGCWPCTRPVEEGEDARAGRWSGLDKTECGIHLGHHKASPSKAA